MPLPNLAPAPCAVCGKQLDMGAGVVDDTTYRVTCKGACETAWAQPQTFKRLRVLLTLANGRPVARAEASTPEQLAAFRRIAQGASVQYRDGLWLFAMADLEEVRAAFSTEADVSVDTLLVTARENAKAEAEGRLVKSDERLALLEAKAEFPIQNYQRSGALWLRQQLGGCLQADPAGAGKSAQIALAADLPMIVVCPASVKEAWRMELARWRPDLKSRTLDASNVRDGVWQDLLDSCVLIMNYEIMPEEWPILPPNVTLVFDEAHRLRNKTSKTSRETGEALARTWWRAKSLSDQVLANGGRVWLVTGDPLFNKPEDLYNLLEIIDQHSIFGTKKDFRAMFGAVQDFWGKWIYGMPTPEVAKLLRRVMLRRPESMIERMLPPRRFENMIVEIDKATKEAADEALRVLDKMGVDLRDAIVDAKSTKRSRIAFEEISRIYGQLSRAKTPAAFELAQRLEDEGEPMVAFATHLDPLRALGDRDGWAVLEGKVSEKKRAKMIRDFQASKLRGLGVSIHAGGFGITLTRSKYTINIDEDWVPANNRQARKRVYRLGQQRSVVHYRLLANHSLDKRIADINDEKERLFVQTVEAACAPVPEGLIPPQLVQTLDLRPLEPPKRTQALSLDLKATVTDDTSKTRRVTEPGSLF